MLKQEILSDLHSKAKWYSVNQLKKVQFDLNPNLDKNESLHLEIEDLKHKSDPEPYLKPNSTVLGEVYGKKHPVMKISNVEIDEIWPLAVSDIWDSCSSLRVSDGEMLNQIMDTFQQLINENLIYQFSTNIYDQILVGKKEKCLNYPEKKCQSETDLHKKQKTTKHLDVEVTSLKFVYYATSIHNLLHLLHSDGLTHVTSDDVIRQNTPAVCLRKICGNNLEKNVDKIPGKDLELCYADIMGRKRDLYHRKLTLGNLSWPNHVENIEENIKDKFSFDKAKELIHQNQINRMNISNKLNFIKKLEKGHKLSSNIYSKWWYSFIAIHNDLKYPNTTCSKLSNRTKPTNMKHEDNNSQILPTSIKHSSEFQNQTHDRGTNRAKKAGNTLITKNVNKMNIDNWQCVCDVCTGDFLEMDRLLEQRFDPKDKTLYSSDDSIVSTKVLHTVKDAGKSGQRSKSTMELQSFERKGETVKSRQSKKNLKTNRRPGNDIWWHSVSKYTTPYWKEKNVSDEEELEEEIEIIPGQLHGKKLKINYSFDNLKAKRKKKMSIKRESKLRESLVGGGDALNPTDYTTLKDLGILFSRNPGTLGCYTKIQLSRDLSQEKLTSNSNSGSQSVPKSLQPFSKNVSSNGKKLIHKRSSVPVITEQDKSSKMNERRNSLPNFLGTTDSILKRMIPTTSLEDKCNVYIESSQDKNSFLDQLDVDVNIMEKLEKQFDKTLPKNFKLMCLAALRCFIIRYESVMTSKKFQKIGSLTINRHPLYSFEKISKAQQKPLSSYEGSIKKLPK